MPDPQKASSLVGVDVGGKYRIVRVMGTGGMGIVCEARHLDLSKRVAIKLVDKELARNHELAARFRREARATAAIESEHVVDVFDVGEDPALGVYMVMEYLVGEDLAARLAREGRVGLDTGLRLAHQLARGMAKAHRARIVHRDLKPGNVFLTSHEDGSLLVKVLDFGISKQMDAVSDASSDGVSPDAEDPLGTPLYMSPEQIEGLPDLDQRADIWALGAVLFEALAGRPPFEEREAYHLTLLAILKDDPPRLASVAPWVPAGVARVVDDMLVRDRDRRIRDCQELIHRLTDAAPELRHGHKTIILTRGHDSDADDHTDSSARLARVPEELPSDPTLVGMPRLDPLAPGPREARPQRTTRRPYLSVPLQPRPTTPPAATSSAAHVMSTAPVVSGGSEGPAAARAPAGTASRSVAITAGMLLIAAATGSMTFATARHHAAARAVPSAVAVPARPAASTSASAEFPLPARSERR